MRPRIRAALDAAGQGFSPDRVVADPELNAAFLAACREQGCSGSPATLNRALLNLRKAGHLRGRKSLETSFPDIEEYRFAAEMAARFLERREGVSLDAIICDPQLAEEFDQLAAAIMPGFTSLQYRWAALNLRKKKKLQPELLTRLLRPELIANFAVASLAIAEIPARQGIYLFHTQTTPLYAGEAESLQVRIRKHLDHSDNKGLARWLWENVDEPLFLEIQVYPDDTETRVRKALELEVIRSRNPVFNVKR
jgi:site-specific DNA-methyltransferase (adenine-specific)